MLAQVSTVIKDFNKYPVATAAEVLRLWQSDEVKTITSSFLSLRNEESKSKEVFLT